MSALNDLMTRLLGPNWKTSLSAISNALLSLAGTGAVVTAVLSEDPKWKTAAACLTLVFAALSALCKVLNGLVAADSTTATAYHVAAPTQTIDLSKLQNQNKGDGK